MIFYGMNRENPVIDEIIYHSYYALRHLLGDNKIFDENLKKEVPVLDIIQQVFNNVNQHYSWIVAGNQRGYDENQLRKLLEINNINKFLIMLICFMLCLQNLLIKIPPRKLRIRRMTKLRSLPYA